MKIKSLILLGLLPLSAQAMFAGTELKVNSASGYVNQSFNLTANAGFGIQNNTNTHQTYFVKYQLCPENKDCFYEERRIDLDPTQRIQEKFKINLGTRYAKPGNYRLTGRIWIEGESKADQTDYGSIQVYPK